MPEFLKVGDRSPRVAEVRSTLARLGLLPNWEGSAAEENSPQWSGDDDLFDEDMRNALLAFQQSRGVYADGIIRDSTLRLLREASYTLGTRVLSYDPLSQMTGEDVGVLQATLQELGFHDARVDGHFGPKTDASVREYQLNYGLEPDGICGPVTLRALSYLGRRVTGGSVNAFHEKEILRTMGPKLSGKRIVIDPGLGAGEPGIVVDGPYGQISEEEILWDLASRIEGRLVAAGAETILSRPRTDNPSIEDRAEMANAFGADVFISLQADHYHNNRASGIATFYFGSMKGSNSILGEQLSGLIQREIVARTSLVDCRSHARTWDLLRLTRMPTVEVAVGYLTNEEDVAILSSPDQRDVIAESIVVAVKRLYLGDEEQQPMTGAYSFAQLIEEEKA
ncbi:N-acetylmuramoyl-L-alanine amidase [Corynebacterium sp. HMSC076C10]|uniref:N-acetylmuramoyl-L-alanine amidase n=1 Tax=Corynebacterium sp. HMSC076C10 TaxID=1739361 RepID=UPI0008A17870|nr:N-acetylmuramoyl-L-alanine amidase [Corynebacterium sp. HMSC076C10]OFJ60029.1 N-acetylmuramoyl-L-alanine amidase [Corynebacterium sp. HMSC076C10]